MSPAESTPRALAPDLSRGLMLALIALANVMIYLYDRPYGLRQHVVEDGAADRLVGGLLLVAVDGRAYPLFAALFGYGLVRIVERSGPAAVRRRGAWLLLFGLVHAVAGFSGDILGWYGLLAALVASRLGLPDRTLLRLAAAWLVLASLVQGVVYSDPLVRTQRTFLWSFAIADPVAAAGWRMVEWVLTPFGLLAVVSPLLLGVWAGRRRMLERPEPHHDLLRATAVVGIPAGLLGGATLAVLADGLAHGSTPVPYPVVLAASIGHVLTGVLGGLGYAAALTLLSARLERSGRATRSPVVRLLRATGERSLSAYLAQTVVFVALLPAWTLGGGASLSTASAAGLALATWAATVLLAGLAARLGRRGPAEALLRRVSATHTARAPARATIGR